MSKKKVVKKPAKKAVVKKSVKSSHKYGAIIPEPKNQTIDSFVKLVGFKEITGATKIKATDIVETKFSGYLSYEYANAFVGNKVSSVVKDRAAIRIFRTE